MNFNIDDKNFLLQSAKCREIVKEIMDFGINQDQVLILIRLLALELENREMMQSIRKSIEDNTDTSIVI